MGYRTTYTLTVNFVVGNKIVQLVDDEPLQAVIAEFRGENEQARYALQEDGTSGDDSKWYDHQTDMMAFSAKHPGVLFTLHGEGEENEDIWNEYYLDGKMQVAKAQMQIAPFDPKLLR